MLASFLVHEGQAAVSNPRSSLLLLIDVSGSMRDEIGGGNSTVKITAAKEAATAAVRRAARRGKVEIAVLAFEGDCANPVPRFLDFTNDFSALDRFISSLQPGGGTPMAPALLFANRFMKDKGAASARDHMVVLLADGQNDCGSVTDALAELSTTGIIFRHETVGFGIEPNSAAANDLRSIATESGGEFHHAADAAQLGDLFMKFVDTFTVIDMLGMFGGGGHAANQTPSPTVGTQTAQEASPSGQGQVTDLLGQFRSKQTSTKKDDPPIPPDEAVLCYRQFVNPSGLPGIRNQFAVTEFLCASSCESFGKSPFSTGETQVRNQPAMTCPQKCAYAASAALGASFIPGRSIYDNYCVSTFDSLQLPVAVKHYYCDYKDNKHRVVWKTETPPTGEYRVFLNNFPDRNDEADFLGETRGVEFRFEYGINFHDNPVVDGLNLWDPFPTAGVSACNKYGICTRVVYGEVIDDCEP